MAKKTSYVTKIFAVLLILCTLGLCCSTAFAYSTVGGLEYEHTFNPNMPNPETTRDFSARTVTQETDVYLPFVTRNTASVGTNYFLCRDQNGTQIAAANMITLRNAERQNFTYFTGEDNTQNKTYYMVYAPADNPFDVYRVSGYWNS